MSIVKRIVVFTITKNTSVYKKNVFFQFAKPEELQRVVGMNWDIYKMNTLANDIYR